MNIIEIAQMTETEAREFLEETRWPNGPVCPHCDESNKITKLEGDKHRPGTYQCNSCRKQFTVTVKTIMHRSKLPIVKWIMAFFVMCSAKKGVSALQVQRQLGLGSYRTAWHMCHRIRFAMKEESFSSLLGSYSGTVEVDETYVGGKPRKGSKEKVKRGRGTKKVSVVALIDREGQARSRPVSNLSGKTMKGRILENVDRSARIMTDEFKPYKGIGKNFEGGHHTVNHGKGEYSRGDVHVNSAECYFSLFKRGFIGSFHKMSEQHMHRYCDEFDFRWSHRKDTDEKRTLHALRGIEGKRLMLRERRNQEIKKEIDDTP